MAQNIPADKLRQLSEANVRTGTGGASGTGASGPALALPDTGSFSKEQEEALEVLDVAMIYSRDLRMRSFILLISPTHATRSGCGSPKISSKDQWK